MFKQLPRIFITHEQFNDAFDLRSTQIRADDVNNPQIIEPIEQINIREPTVCRQHKGRRATPHNTSSQSERTNSRSELFRRAFKSVS